MYPEDNANSHQTSKFELTQQEPETGGIPPSPVLRRGLSFYMTVRFDRPYNPEIDTIRIHFYFGNFIFIKYFYYYIKIDFYKFNKYNFQKFLKVHDHR